MTNRISEVFGLHSVAVASDAGVKGVFLINYGMSSEEVLELVMTIRRAGRRTPPARGRAPRRPGHRAD